MGLSIGVAPPHSALTDRRNYASWDWCRELPTVNLDLLLSNHDTRFSLYKVSLPVVEVMQLCFRRFSAK